MLESSLSSYQEPLMHLVTVRDLHKHYQMGGKIIRVLSGVDLDIRRGETVAIVGPSGVGKSTLLHLLGALDRPTKGEITFDGVQYWELSELQMARMRANQIGFVFQFHHLLPEFTALENVILAGLIRGGKIEDHRDRAAELLGRVGLSQRLDHKPGELSGGEQQRVALARALQNNPPLVLADEPTGNLDRHTALELQDLIFELALEQSLTFLIVTHDIMFAERCSRILRLKEGLAVATAPDELKEALK
jgi:lipoprotein-releasing system ATP-binding protein